MYVLHTIEFWADHHHPKWIEYLRILLGLILIIKGIAFIDNKDEVIIMLKSGGWEFYSFITAHYVIGAYLAGGIAITIGIYTRLAVLTILPAVLGTIFFIDMHKNLFALNSQLIYSVLVLGLLLFFLLYGSGKFSVDDYLDKHQVAE